jgi:Protein of unknown function (DUF3617)
MHPSRPRFAARAAAASAALLSCTLLAQALHLKPGLYQIVTTSQVTLSPEMQKRLPPGYLQRLQQPHTTQQCISEADLNKVSEQLAEERGHDPSCTMTEHSVSGDKVKFVLKCQRATTHFDGSFQGTSFKATLDSTTDHGPMHAEVSGQRSGDCQKDATTKRPADKAPK